MDHETDARAGGAGEGEEVGGGGAREYGGVDGGVAVVEEGVDQPCAYEAVGSGDADRRFLFRSGHLSLSLELGFDCW